MRSKYRRTTPEIPVFFILRCLKMHNCVNELISCNSEHVHKLNTHINTKMKRKSIMHFKTAQDRKYWIFRVRASVFTTYDFF